ncbi:MAG TPA: hypothetical protein VJA21_02980 [Verrucomicrobiae bacterium]
MNSDLLAATATGQAARLKDRRAINTPLACRRPARHGQCACSRPVMASIGALVLLCLLTVPESVGASVFSPLPTRPSVVLTNPIILITPKALSFGVVPAGKSATNTFLIENVGRGELIGRASVPAPFKIISGGDYILKQNEIQVVTLEFTPGRGLTNIAAVTFTGGGGAKAAVIGRRSGGQD